LSMANASLNEAAPRQEKPTIPRYAPQLPNVGQFC
jgi:hypothetical protein